MRTLTKQTDKVEFCNAFASMGLDNGFKLEEFERNLKISVISKSKDTLELELKGIDAPVVNALRRILLDEVG